MVLILGINIGHEQDGKNEKYNRPVLIVRKFNKRLFWGVPLTTKTKDTPHYHKFTLKNKDQCVMLTQMRLWDATRLTGVIGRIPKAELQSIKGALREYLK